MIIIPAFQAGDAGLIPATRSRDYLQMGRDSLKEKASSAHLLMVVLSTYFIGTIE